MVFPNTPRFNLQPCAHSWVALHPRPKGVIQFIGSTGLGTWPTIAYRHFLKSLFEAGYTVVAFPFRFTFNHWSIALNLLDEHYAVRGAMVETAVAKGFDASIYLQSASYTWVGHGLGCKYVALLELLSEPVDRLQEQFQVCGLRRAWQQWQVGLADLRNSLRYLEQRIYSLTGQRVDYGEPSIRDEASLLLAPVMIDLEGAIPVKFLERLLGHVITVQPTVEQTHELIEHSQRFQLTGLLQFARDRIAAPTCHQLMQEQPHIRRRLLKGNHSEVVGIQIGPCIVDLNPLDKFIQPLKCRDLELKCLTLLHRLRHRSVVMPCGSSCRANGRQRSMAA
ncbi:MAG: DUF1350 family protein [Cyanobacteria bacterium P01_C01_bin.118]